MLKHHVAVYDALKRKFPDAEVVFGTSDKVEPGSPFTFKEKQAIAIAHGIDPNNVIEARSPYVHTFYKDKFNFDEYFVFFAVGKKDVDERFTMNNIDPNTGLDMKIKPNKDTGEFEPKYYQMINTYDKDNPKSMAERGYILPMDNELIDGEVASASAFREALRNAPDKEAAKEVFNTQFSDYKENIFNLVYNKIVGEKMSEDLNILKQLAGLEVQESAPVEFESSVNIDDLSFTPVSKSTAFHSIANRFPEGSDVNDPAVKREEFIQALLKSPANLLAEINERISPADDNGLEAGEKLNKIIHQLEKDDSSITKLNDDDKKFVMELVKKAIKEMELSAGDETEYEEEPKEENLDLSGIRDDYGIEEDEEIAEGGDCYHCDGKDEDCEHCDGDGYVKFDDDPNEPSQEEIDDNEAAYKKYIGKHKDESVEESSEDSGEGSIKDMSDEDLMDYVGQKEEDLIDDMQQHIAPDFLHKDNYEETFEKYREEVLEPAAHEISQDAADGMEPADADYEESIETASNNAFDQALEELKKLAGLELNEEETEDCPKCGKKRHVLKACSSCGCS